MRRHFKLPILTFALLLFFVNRINAQSTSSNDAFHQHQFVTIGDIEQWITIDGEDTSNPVILFLHGGPGSTFSPFAEATFGDWQKDFVLVQWDQRGAGRTFGKYAPEELTKEFILKNALTIEQMTNDGIEVAEYVINLLGKQKIILFGSSWGSALGVNMATKRPDLFYAYVGHSQIVNPSKTLVTSYSKVYSLAERSDDEQSITQLKSLGQPPYDEARKFGQLFRIIKKYEAQNAEPAPEEWWQWSEEYNNEKDRNDRFSGDDFSFINYTGQENLGIQGMYEQIKFDETSHDFKIPVYFVQGENDLLTYKESTRKYFETIQAPEKEYILISDTAHDFNEAMMKKTYEVMLKISESIGD